MNEKNILGKCPACGGDITRGPETLKGYGCSNYKNEDIKCNFVIWKNFYDKKITEPMVKALLSKQKTSIIKGWVSRKTQSTFEAALKLEKVDGEYRVLFDFS